MIVIRRRHKGRRVGLAAVAGAAGDGQAGVLDHADVVVVDVLNHFEHEARGALFRLGVIGKVEAWMAVKGGSLGIDGVAMAAFGAERLCPVMHDVVDLLAGEGLGQHLEIFGRRHGGKVVLGSGGGWIGGLGHGSDREGRGEQQSRDKGQG